jgi:hypothetical protein
MQNSIITHWNGKLSRPTTRRWLAIAVFLAALASYLVPIIRRGELSLPPAPGGDEPDYDAIAVQLAKGRGFAVDWDDEDYRRLYERAEIGGKAAKPHAGDLPAGSGDPRGTPIGDDDSQYAYLFDRHGASATAFRPPLLPAVLSATYRIFGRQFAPIRIINCVCLALACTLIFLFLFSRCGALPGLLAALLFVIVEPRLRLYPQAVLTECLGCLFATVCVGTLLVVVKRQSTRWAIAAGLFTGMAILTRNVFAVWAPVMAIVIYALARPREAKWLSLAAVRLPVIFTAACLTLLAPWMVRNCLLLESVSPLGLQGAMGLSQGYSDKAVAERGEWFNPDEIGFYDGVRSGAGQSPLDLEKAMAAHSRGEAMKWIASHPQLVPWLAFQKSCSMWRPTGRRDCFLFLFALSGVVGLWRLDRAAAIVVLIVMGANTAAVAMTFSGGDRFLVPLVPVLTGLSGLGVWTWIRGTTELELSPPVAAEAVDRIEYNLGANIGEWPERLEAAWQMIDGLRLTESATVGDFGCGRQALRGRLPSTWSYVPFDRIARSDDTRICDFDSELPEGHFDVAVCLGLLEYVQDPLRVLSHFAGRSKWLLVSYCGGGTAQTRAREGWVNHLDYAAVEKCVESAGGRIFAVEVDWHQRMWLFDCSRSGAAAQPDESKCLKGAA